MHVTVSRENTKIVFRKMLLAKMVKMAKIPMMAKNALVV
jgi:hypothetical protein